MPTPVGSYRFRMAAQPVTWENAPRADRAPSDVVLVRMLYLIAKSSRDRRLRPRAAGDLRQPETRPAGPELDHPLHLWVDQAVRGLPPDGKRALGDGACPPVNDVGKRDAGEPHARFEAAGTGDGATATAPVPDPTTAVSARRPVVQCPSTAASWANCSFRRFRRAWPPPRTRSPCRLRAPRPPSAGDGPPSGDARRVHHPFTGASRGGPPGPLPGSACRRPVPPSAGGYGAGWCADSSPGYGQWQRQSNRRREV
ncbi:hypothetical protein EDD90_1456 [Streptomyces sp. Ag109_O5-1]|nr:hypothetical protein EDD90_1456 [Streptomyces sp. Ag109_O5-1]